MRNLFDGAKLALLREDGSEDEDAYYYAHDLRMPDSYNDRLIQFGPWHSAAKRPLTHWAILDAEGETLDYGPLVRRRSPVRGDRILFQRGSIKSAAVGDILGVTCVFMPSGFAVGVPVAVTPVSSGADDFAYPEQPELWLRKRRWQAMPTLEADGAMSATGFSMIHGWQRWLPVPDVGIKEVMRKRQQQLVLAGVL